MCTPSTAGAGACSCNTIFRRPEAKISRTSAPFFAAMVDEMVRAVDAGLVPTGQYDAVLIDEAHDFEPAWLRLAARMVSPATKSLFIVYDNAQSIYGKRKTPVWSQLGIEAKGRTTVMKLNYRNTNEICTFAVGSRPTSSPNLSTTRRAR